MTASKAYDDVIMDHIKNVRGYRALAQPTRVAKGTNPLCGDEVHVYLEISGEHIVEAAFQCTCCGISMASASIMTESVKGMKIGEARKQLRRLLDSLRAANAADPMVANASHRALLKTVHEFPARTRCASLPWVTLEAALDDKPEAVVTR